MSCPSGIGHARVLPPEAPFTTSNGYRWSLISSGTELVDIPSGPVRAPVYKRLGAGQFGRVFEVKLVHDECKRTKGSSKILTKLGPSVSQNVSTDICGERTDRFQGCAESGTAKVHHRRPGQGCNSNSAIIDAAAVACSGGRFAVKLLLLQEFEKQGLSADVLRELSLYAELEGCARAFVGSKSASGSQTTIPPFNNILRSFGSRPCVTFSKEFAQMHLDGTMACGVLVVELCAGDLASFSRRLWAENKICIASIKFIAWQLLSGLAKLHCRGIVHRDLKPENILVASPPITEGASLLAHGVGVFKLADLGLARKIRGALSQEAAGSGSCTPFTLSGLTNGGFRDTGTNSEVQVADKSNGDSSSQNSNSVVCDDPTLSHGCKAFIERLCTGVDMRQSGLIVTLPYRPPEVLVASGKRSGSKGPVGEFGFACDIWSLAVVLLELCLPQKSQHSPSRWGYAFVFHDARRANFSIEFLILENIFKVLGSPEPEDIKELTRQSGSSKEAIRSFLGAFPYLSHADRKGAIQDFILERRGLHLDDLGLDLLARLLHVSPRRRLTAEAALAHPWFSDLPFNAMDRIGLSSHLADLCVPELRHVLPVHLRKCVERWTSRGLSVSQTRFSVHGLLQASLAHVRTVKTPSHYSQTPGTKQQSELQLLCMQNCSPTQQCRHERAKSTGDICTKQSESPDANQEHVITNGCSTGSEGSRICATKADLVHTTSKQSGKDFQHEADTQELGNATVIACKHPHLLSWVCFRKDECVRSAEDFATEKAVPCSQSRDEWQKGNEQNTYCPEVSCSQRNECKTSDHEDQLKKNVDGYFDVYPNCSSHSIDGNWAANRGILEHATRDESAAVSCTYNPKTEGRDEECTPPRRAFVETRIDRVRTRLVRKEVQQHASQRTTVLNGSERGLGKKDEINMLSRRRRRHEPPDSDDEVARSPWRCMVRSVPLSSASTSTIPALTAPIHCRRTISSSADSRRNPELLSFGQGESNDVGMEESNCTALKVEDGVMPMGASAPRQRQMARAQCLVGVNNRSFQPFDGLEDGGISGDVPGAQCKDGCSPLGLRRQQHEDDDQNSLACTKHTKHPELGSCVGSCEKLRCNKDSELKVLFTSQGDDDRLEERGKPKKSQARRLQARRKGCTEPNSSNCFHFADGSADGVSDEDMSSGITLDENIDPSKVIQQSPRKRRLLCTTIDGKKVSVCVDHNGAKGVKQACTEINAKNENRTANLFGCNEKTGTARVTTHPLNLAKSSPRIRGGTKSEQIHKQKRYKSKS